jgi:hypothetical protein
MQSIEASDIGQPDDPYRDPYREVLLWALSAYLRPSQAREAAALWQPPSAGQTSATVGLSRYCRNVAKQFDLQGKEAELHLRIIRGFQSRPKVSRADLAPGAAEGNEVSATSAAWGLPEHSANDSQPPRALVPLVQSFLEAIEAVVSRECPEMYSPRLWRQSLLLKGQRLPPEAQKALSDWLWGRTSCLLGDWPARGSGTRLTNAAYVTLAEWLGPVRADACFTGIVRDFENSTNPAMIGIRKYL